MTHVHHTHKQKNDDPTDTHTHTITNINIKPPPHTQIYIPINETTYNNNTIKTKFQTRHITRR